jgi:sugar/nucleoside kinase (ribokinase family)
MSKYRVTITDVAKLAKVSLGTVSNVLNGTASVRPRTRARVEAAIAELNFAPNALARTLPTRHRGPGTAVDPSVPRLVAVGSVSVDYIARVSVMPHRNDRITAHNIEKSLGGPATNVAVIAAGLGAPFPLSVELATAVGDDADSDWALGELIERSVDIEAVRRVPGQRLSRCIVFVEENGSRTVVNEPVELDVSDLRRYGEPSETEAPRCICIDGSHIEHMLDSLLGLGRAGWRIALQSTDLPSHWRNPDRFRQMLEELDLIFINRRIARDLTDCRGSEVQLVEAVVESVKRVPAKAIVVLTLGERGALVIPPRQEPIAVPAKSVDVVDVTGNGGALAGVFIAVWLHTGNPALAADWGTAAGSFISSVLGALGASPTAAELQTLLTDKAPEAMDVAVTL